MRCFSLFIIMCVSLLHAEEATKSEPLEEVTKTTSHSIRLNGSSLEYTATAGTITLKDDKNSDKASIFYVAYTKEPASDDFHNRPITFCFNGGPGSSSVWLHLGAFGPRRVDISGVEFDPPPYDLIDNPDTLLDVTDLVFIDPVSTGYSRAAVGEDVKQFHGVEGDVQAVAEFIRVYTTRNGRWESPKFLAGESYGSTRAAALADYLQDTYGMYVNGVMLISSVLNFQTILTDDGNDLPYPLMLPSYTAAAHYHNRLSADLQSRPLTDLLQEVELFALTDYTTALNLGPRLDSAKRDEVIKKLAAYTGLDESFITRNNLRVDSAFFAKELLRSQGKNIGRFDVRVTGDDINPALPYRDYDPSYQAVYGAFTAAFYQYVNRELDWKTDDEYRVLTSKVWPWDFGTAKNSYLNIGTNLREAMIKNPSLNIFVASGYYDMATPYLGIDYTLDHMNLPTPLRSHIAVHYYDGGHMMYTDLTSLKKLKQDLARFITSLPRP